MSRHRLVEMAKDNLANAQHDTIPLEPDVFKVPAANYYDLAHFEAEKKRVFKRIPLVLAPTAELPNPGDYKAMDAAGVPVLLSRDSDGRLRAFINSCSHRGTAVALEGCGNRRRFTCPYHGWTFDGEGRLAGIASSELFGDIDRSQYALTPLPVLERAGLIWCVLDPQSDLDIGGFLSGYDTMLANFGLDTWHLFDKRTIRGRIGRLRTTATWICTTCPYSTKIRSAAAVPTRRATRRGGRTNAPFNRPDTRSLRTFRKTNGQ